VGEQQEDRPGRQRDGDDVQPFDWATENGGCCGCHRMEDDVDFIEWRMMWMSSNGGLCGCHLIAAYILNKLGSGHILNMLGSGRVRSGDQQACIKHFKPQTKPHDCFHTLFELSVICNPIGPPAAFRPCCQASRPSLTTSQGAQARGTALGRTCARLATHSTATADGAAFGGRRSSAVSACQSTQDNASCLRDQEGGHAFVYLSLNLRSIPTGKHQPSSCIAHSALSPVCVSTKVARMRTGWACTRLIPVSVVICLGFTAQHQQ